MKKRVEINGFTVKYSNVILYRQVRSDIDVGEWYELDFPVYPPTLSSLKRQMGTARWIADKWDVSKLCDGESFTWNPEKIKCYGKNVQFWVPFTEEEWDAIPQSDKDGFEEGTAILKCVDDFGVEGLTRGEMYKELGFSEKGLVTIENDIGERKEYMVERFVEAVEDEHGVWHDMASKVA